MSKQFNWNYNYSPRDHKHFMSNANIITQYIDVNDDEYLNYYHNSALLYAVQIHQNQINSFENYVKNNPITIDYEYAIRYVIDNEKANKERS